MAPHMLDADVHWTQLFDSVLDIMCFERYSFNTTKFDSALAAFESDDWSMQQTSGTLTRLHGDYHRQLLAMTTAAQHDQLDVKASLPTMLRQRQILLEHIQSRILRKAKDLLITGAPALCDMTYADAQLEKLHEEHLWQVLDVAERLTYSSATKAKPPLSSDKTAGKQQADRALRTGRHSKEVPEGKTPKRWQVKAAAVTLPTTTTTADLQKAAAGKSNETSQYILENGVWLSPHHKFGRTDCSNCNKPHWHDKPCNWVRVRVLEGWKEKSEFDFSFQLHGLSCQCCLLQLLQSVRPNL